MKAVPQSCCFTGYRPQKFPFPLERGIPDYVTFENKLTDAVFSLPQEGCRTFYTGMAMGFDLIAAETVLLFRKLRPDAGVRLIGVVPFRQQSLSFSAPWRERYNRVAALADEVVILGERYSPGCYQRRNEYMVDRSDLVITWFDGAPGGTRSTLRYAERCGRRIVNLCEAGVHEYAHEEDFVIERELP